MTNLLRRLCFLIVLIWVFAFSAYAADTETMSVNYTDVATSDWFYKYVDYANHNELMNGVSADSFDPYGTSTRGMVVTVLYRLAGSPDSGTVPFTDVKPGSWYYNAVGWAYENDIVQGYTEDIFGPNDNVTREQMVTIFFRYVSSCGSETPQRSNLNIFTDEGDISRYAQPAIQWAVAAGLLDGRSDTELAPQGDTLRSELAAFLYKLIERVLKNDDILHPETVNIPIFTFHSVTQGTESKYSMSVENFDKTMETLYHLGYQSVSYRQILDYVDHGTPLPDKPMVITFDDGYTDNLTNAYPVLTKYGYCCEIAVIGCYVGLSEYADYKLTPHFSFEEVLALEPGVVGIQSHTMRMHMTYDWADISRGRTNVARRTGESVEAYHQTLLADFSESYHAIEIALGAPQAMTYPRGVFSPEAEQAAEEVGFRITVTTRPGSNIITMGDPDSLKLLNRFYIDENTTAAELEAMVVVK